MNALLPTIKDMVSKQFRDLDKSPEKEKESEKNKEDISRAQVKEKLKQKDEGGKGKDKDKDKNTDNDKDKGITSPAISPVREVSDTASVIYHEFPASSPGPSPDSDSSSQWRRVAQLSDLVSAFADQSHELRDRERSGGRPPSHRHLRTMIHQLKALKQTIQLAIKGTMTSEEHEKDSLARFASSWL